MFLFFKEKENRLSMKENSRDMKSPCKQKANTVKPVYFSLFGKSGLAGNEFKLRVRLAFACQTAEAT